MITLFCIRPKGFNVGNDAIYMGMQYYLYQAFDEIVNIITLPATSRYENHGKAGLTAKTIFEINQYGHGVILGGGNLYENGEIDINLDALNSLDVPLMLFSLSRGRIYNRRHELSDRTDALPDRVLKALNAKAELSLARDTATRDYLHKLGCHYVKTGGCPTIYLDRTVNRLPQIPKQEKGGVLISVRHPSLMSIPLHKQAQLFEDIQNIIKFVQTKGYSKVRLLCHDHRDITFAASFPGIEYVYTGDVYSYLAMLHSCELNITYRLHSALPCLAYGKPVIKISYDERAMSLMDTIGFDKWNIKMMETEDVLKQVADRHSRLHELPRIKESALKKWRVLDNTMRETFKSFSQKVFQYKAKLKEESP